MAILRHRQEAVSAVATVDEEPFNVLELKRLTSHPTIAPLMTRREALYQKKVTLLEDQRQCEAVRKDFEHAHAVGLAEEQPEIVQRWKEVNQRLQAATDQIALVESGLLALDEEIDASMGSVRQEVQSEVDALFVEPVQAMVDALQAMVRTNNRLHELERCSHRLLQTGNIALYNPALEGWLYRLQRKLALVAPR